MRKTATAFVIDVETRFEDGYKPELKLNKDGSPSARQPQWTKSLMPLRCSSWENHRVGGDLISCVGARKITKKDDVYEEETVFLKASPDELEIIGDFLAWFLSEETLGAKTVTFNGYRFDESFITMRLIVRGIAPSAVRSFRERFNKRNGYDIKFPLDSYIGGLKGFEIDGGEALESHSLDNYAKFFGVYTPCHLEGVDGEIDGSRVQELVDSGNWEGLEKYNENDLITTGKLFIILDQLGLIDYFSE